MEKLFYVSILLTISLFSTVHSELQCYVCVDCPLADASDLKTCSALTSTDAPTTESSTAASSQTTSNSPPIVANPSTITDIPTIANTAAVTSPITTISPTSTNSITTTASATSAASIGPVTASPITTAASQAITTSPSSASSSIGSSSPVTASNHLNSFTDSPIFVISSAPSNSLKPTVNTISRKKRFAKKDKECICNNGKCDCNYKRLSSVHMNDFRAVKYQCYKHKHTVNGTEVIDRGCKEITNGTSETACSLLNATEGCYHCETDKCNSAFYLQCSIVLFVLCLSIVNNILK